MIVNRPRFFEHYRRILREDMLTLFDRVVEMDRLECSIVLANAGLLTDEAKYRAACVLELLTGIRPWGGTCDIAHQDPLHQNVSLEQQRSMDKMRGAALWQGRLEGKKHNMPRGKQPKAPILTAADFKKTGSGFMLKSELNGIPIFQFLEKLREFYLPDVVGREQYDSPESAPVESSRVVPERGHGNNFERKHLLSHFQQTTRPMLSTSAPRMRIPLDKDNPSEAITTYVLRSSDLLRMPDIEVHFEAIGKAFQTTGDEALHLILRPTLTIDYRIRNDAQAHLPPVENIKAMNCLLSQFFCDYLKRPRVSRY